MLSVLTGYMYQWLAYGTAQLWSDRDEVSRRWSMAWGLCCSRWRKWLGPWPRGEQRLEGAEVCKLWRDMLTLQPRWRVEPDFGGIARMFKWTSGIFFFSDRFPRHGDKEEVMQNLSSRDQFNDCCLLSPPPAVVSSILFKRKINLAKRGLISTKSLAPCSR